MILRNACNNHLSVFNKIFVNNEDVDRLNGETIQCEIIFLPGGIFCAKLKYTTFAAAPISNLISLVHCHFLILMDQYEDRENYQKATK